MVVVESAMPQSSESRGRNAKESLALELAAALVAEEPERS